MEANVTIADRRYLKGEGFALMNCTLILRDVIYGDVALLEPHHPCLLWLCPFRCGPYDERRERGYVFPIYDRGTRDTYEAVRAAIARVASRDYAPLPEELEGLKKEGFALEKTPSSLGGCFAWRKGRYHLFFDGGFFLMPEWTTRQSGISSYYATFQDVRLGIAQGRHGSRLTE